MQMRGAILLGSAALGPEGGSGLPDHVCAPAGLGRAGPGGWGRGAGTGR